MNNNIFPSGWDETKVRRVIEYYDTQAEDDETTYLLKSEANRKQLLKALENANKGKLIAINLDEYEKNHLL